MYVHVSVLMGMYMQCSLVESRVCVSVLMGMYMQCSLVESSICTCVCAHGYVHAVLFEIAGYVQQGCTYYANNGRLMGM